MRIPLAREGLPFILGTTVPAIVLLSAAAYIGGTLLWIVAFCVAVLAVFVLAFFRDPERAGPKGPDLVVSPADGKVIDIRLVEESSYMKSESLCMSIFLSLFDVHVNRYPVTGDVDHRTYDAGRFEPAWRRSASHSNERASTGIQSVGHSVLVRQIAGLAAKRIVTYAKLGDRVEQGDRMGLIRFGSRVEVFLPKESAPKVRVGQRAVGGMTVLAQLTAGSEGPE
ncbi:MAG: phosphatidylserine decarboxylase family protein [Gemmatimonadota bacterium]|nr:MAG: phosphatidylserine decarboxylase family protein [Gemmatimonadota bacterium]